jgi:phosphoribosyl 1,2-cyclic phosphodiesterase
MAVYFQSVCSSSSGNCLTLWTEKTRLVIDCGLGSMKKTRAALESMGGPSVDAVLLSHVHTDHIGYYPLRALEQCQRPVYLHEDCVEQLKDRHFRDYGFKELKTKPFSRHSFIVGDFLIKPFSVPHMPGVPTFGFELHVQDKKLIIATDFLKWSGVFEHFVDADFIFVESNHDLKLLERYYNPNSQFHMPNPQTAELLVNVQRHSRRTIQTVMLGHISSQRNEAGIALKETRNAFSRANLPMTFELLAAPLKEPSCPVCIV